MHACRTHAALLSPSPSSRRSAFCSTRRAAAARQTAGFQASKVSLQARSPFPPTHRLSDTRCAQAEQDKSARLACPAGTVISSIEFASFGNPTGSCGAYQAGSCHDAASRELVEDLCLGDNSCTVSASASLFDQPNCHDEIEATRQLRVQVSCMPGPHYYEDQYFNEWSRKSWTQARSEATAHQRSWVTYMAALPAYPAHTFHGRGIVMVAGGSILGSALVSISLLRQYGCTLPIELWHLQAELSSHDAELLAQFDVQPKVFEDFVSKADLEPIPSNVGLRVFQLKPLAMLYSSFEEVLLIDADNAPLRNPEYLFDAAEYRSAGALFWPDFWKTSPANPIWDIVHVDEQSGVKAFEQESGQIIVNKKQSWTALNLCVHFNSEFYMQLLNGDKVWARWKLQPLTSACRRRSDSLGSHPTPHSPWFRSAPPRSARPSPSSMRARRASAATPCSNTT